MRDVFLTHQPALRRYAYSLCQQTQMAEDAVQVTWERLSQQAQAEVADRLPAWLFRVCRNYLFDILRREGRMSPLHDQADAFAAEAPSPLAHAESADRHQGLLQLIEQLPPAQREVLRLKFQGDLSYREIADVTHRSVDAVGVLLHTALRTLRGRIQNHPELMA